MAVLFHKHLTLRFDEYERSRFPNTMHILNELTQDEFQLVTSQVRRLSKIAMVLEDVTDRNDPRVDRLLEDSAHSKVFNSMMGKIRRRSSVERERLANEKMNKIFWIIMRVIGMYLCIRFVSVLIWT